LRKLGDYFRPPDDQTHGKLGRDVLPWNFLSRTTFPALFSFTRLVWFLIDVPDDNIWILLPGDTFDDSKGIFRPQVQFTFGFGDFLLNLFFPKIETSLVPSRSLMPRLVLLKTCAPFFHRKFLGYDP